MVEQSKKLDLDLDFLGDKESGIETSKNVSNTNNTLNSKSTSDSANDAFKLSDVLLNVLIFIFIVGWVFLLIELVS